MRRVKVFKREQNVVTTTIVNVCHASLGLLIRQASYDQSID